ncbi:hypothetical protein HanRHA438_Chr09g0375041 [Helianthus annuus]|nr:hypothetical protein HanRHA438_Chr09g0375041 [Helianthus annuus]
MFSTQNVPKNNNIMITYEILKPKVTTCNANSLFEDSLKPKNKQKRNQIIQAIVGF